MTIIVIFNEPVKTFYSKNVKNCNGRIICELIKGLPGDGVSKEGKKERANYQTGPL